MPVRSLYGIQDGVIPGVGLPFKAEKGLYMDFMGGIDTGFTLVFQPGITVIQVFGISLLLQVLYGLGKGLIRVFVIQIGCFWLDA